MKKFLIEFTKKEADSLGLFICECGWPENNHFDFSVLGDKKRPCAHNKKCKNYRPKSRIGKLIK
jgi:hypothetical protein